MQLNNILRRLLRLKFFSCYLLLITIIFVANILVGYLLLDGKLDTEKTILIESNLSLTEISTLLEKEQIISQGKLFTLISRLYSLHQPLKSGEYRFSKKISPLQVLRILTNGKSVIHRFLVQEGDNVHHILAKIQANNLLTGKIIGFVPEGYLMPSTYFYSYQDKRQKLVDEMKREMSLTLDQIMFYLKAESPLKTRQDVLILASMIEKEAGYKDDPSKIAAVFINRLRKNMRLQSDPTTIYAITEGKYPLARPLTYRDLKINSPYNTYIIYGLPKGAICCPGLAALRAATQPAQTNDLYFVANGRGSHNFAKNYRDHLKNVKILRKSQAAKIKK